MPRDGAIKVLVIGGGGREHALAWRCAQSPRVAEVLVAPGNAGTAREPRVRNCAVDPEDARALLALVQAEGVALTICGPEAPLARGVGDAFKVAGLPFFGPTSDCARLESSKAFAKDFLVRHRIPTAEHRTFDDPGAALAHLRARPVPIVIKADGLAAGKGVVVATTREEAEAAVADMLSGNAFGSAGSRVVIEEFLAGEEASFMMMVAGGVALELATSQDHKRVGDGDLGPNTGGMGAYSPAPVVTEAVLARIRREVVEPTLAGLAADGLDYCGFLYAGLMITPEGAPRVIEFNCRLGDPETQPLMMRLNSDLTVLAEAAVARRLGTVAAEWDPRVALGVVMAAAGYPGSPRKGDAIRGLDATPPAGAKVFHAGTKLAGDAVVTSGGRVLCATALGATVAEAQATAYAAASRISWEGEFHRRDIGWRAVARERG
jgi:phosphoribosylamine--glycine ligase